MVKVENIDVWGFEHAIRGMRNPLNSWNKSDSYNCGENGRFCLKYSCVYDEEDHCYVKFYIGEEDLKLMKKLYKAGPEHRKFMRQIFVCMDITAPLYWWKEFDTYKVGVTSNSCSTMHTIAKKEFTEDDFSHEHFHDVVTKTEDGYNIDLDIGYKEALGIDVVGDMHFSPFGVLDITIAMLNKAREKYIETKDKKYWWQMIQLLPSSYNQKRTITMSYENAANIIHQRSHHKLDEWVEFCNILKEELPYLKAIMSDE